MRKIILTSMLTFMFATAGLAQDPGWPRQKSSPAGKLVYYQPQVDDWTNFKELKFRMAFSLTPTGGKQTVGVMNIHAQTDVNVDNRTVSINNLAITDTHFPSLDSGTAAQMGQLVRTFLPPGNSLTPEPMHAVHQHQLLMGPTLSPRLTTLARVRTPRRNSIPARTVNGALRR